jgi:prevent-host-death family protein
MNKIVGAAEFKAKCLAILDEVQATGEPVTITKRGKVVGVLNPPAAAEPTEAPVARFGFMKGTVTIHGDIVGPVDPDWESAWDAKWDARLSPPDAAKQR